MPQTDLVHKQNYLKCILNVPMIPAIQKAEVGKS